MNAGTAPSLRRCLMAALDRSPAARTAIEPALWLYLVLVAKANFSGHVSRLQATLAADLSITDEGVGAGLDVLERHDLIRILVPPPYLVIALCFWSGAGSGAARRTAQMQAVSDALSNVPVPGSSKLLPEQQPKAAPAAGVDGGAGEGEGLLAEVQSVLGTSDGPALQKLLAQHPPPVIRAALTRVARTPSGQIRKSRFALFRYLLTHASTPHDHDPPHQP